MPRLATSRIVWAAWLATAALHAQDASQLTHGPLRGPSDATSLHVWARAAAAGTYTLHLRSLADGAESTCTANADPGSDLTLRFHAAGLTAGTAYDWSITSGERIVYAPAGAPLTTAIGDDATAAAIAFGSCANDVKVPEQPIWGQILARAPQALVLLGDTPYIDDGTVDGRRRRYRAFFAFAAVHAALAAIPTWSTWDDHDYALNDEFGAVKGSETARQVFLEYHAHASYGDGARGIYTSFRRGPIEVFVLDTRSFADTEASLLAPGERSLLGAAQTRWLQRGLRGSTAAFKVLACGMVWNGGVRPGKADCWGNWLPERDALLGWIGAQRLDGVVLVGGDVHRSRVIVHPSRDLAGYDVPELITSPLAQSVIETNAVPVPGLVFDAGEGHSCLLLSATRDGDTATLRATFVAGDGREFHVREFPLAELSKPDAAASYRKIAERLRGVFGQRMERGPERNPESGGLPVVAEDANGPEWRAAIAAARPVFDEWATALAQERCRFRRFDTQDMADVRMSEFMGSLFLPIHELEMLAVGQGLQAIADREPQRLVESVRSLLGLARHLQQEPGGIAWAVAGECERDAVELLQRGAAALGEAAAVPLREQVRQHLGKRAPLAAAAAAMRAETYCLFDESLRVMRLGVAAQAETARRFGQQVRQHGVELLEPIFTRCVAWPDVPTAAQRDELKGLLDEFTRRRRERLEAVRALAKGDPEVAPGPAVAADLALMLASMCCPNVLEQLDEQAKSLAALHESAR
ncbi:MAG TPA: alkaline phosphatase D family protein [Planctomycetota bacterium]|nr:alkaline phosphatase D family protein [Planctomycetota bacterium]